MFRLILYVGSVMPVSSLDEEEAAREDELRGLETVPFP
jgi:hypothetical protein